MLDSLKELWAIIMSLVVFGAWLVRMESRVNSNAKEVLRLERQIERERADTREALADLTIGAAGAGEGTANWCTADPTTPASGW